MARTDSIISIQLPTNSEADIIRWRYQGQPGPRIAVVAGIRGDTPEGMRVAYSLRVSLAKLEPLLKGSIDIYPCVNPLAAEQGERYWPFFGVDLNRLFPGKKNGHPPDRVAYHLVQDIQGADLVCELRGARPGFQESTQALVSSDEAVQWALHTNVKVVWKRTPGPAAPRTFAYQFTNSMVIEGGTGNRLTAEVGSNIHDGLLNLFVQFGILPEDSLPFSWMTMERPVVVQDDEVLRIRTDRSGLFLPQVALEQPLVQGDILGDVVDPATGELKAQITAPRDGTIMALRDQPVISPGEMVARLLCPNKEKR